VVVGMMLVVASSCLMESMRLISHLLDLNLIFQPGFVGFMCYEKGEREAEKEKQLGLNWNLKSFFHMKYVVII